MSFLFVHLNPPPAMIILAFAFFLASILAAIENTPENWVLGFALLGNLIQAIRGRNTRAALETVIEGVEVASTRETNPKRAVSMVNTTAAARALIDAILVNKGYRKR